MKRISAIMLALVIALSFAGCTERTASYKDENGNKVTYTYVTKETSDKFTLFEEALTEKGVVYEVETKAEGIIDGAKEGRKYQFETGETFEIFKFDVKSDAYKEMAKTSKMYMEMFDVYISVAVNDEYALIPVNNTEIKDLFLGIQ